MANFCPRPLSHQCPETIRAIDDRGCRSSLSFRPDATQASAAEIVQRDGASLRREGNSEPVANGFLMLLQRMGSTSVQEIDRLIVELQTLRALLQEEGERVQRKLAEYAHLCQSTTHSTKIIAESLNQWNPAQKDATLTARSSLPALPHRTDPLFEAVPSKERRRGAWGLVVEKRNGPNQESQIGTDARAKASGAGSNDLSSRDLPRPGGGIIAYCRVFTGKRGKSGSASRRRAKPSPPI